MPLTDGQTDGEEEELDEGRKLRTTLAFMCGLGREGMPRNVFRVVMDLLMPSWGPLGARMRARGRRCHRAENGVGGGGGRQQAANDCSYRNESKCTYKECM